MEPITFNAIMRKESAWGQKAMNFLFGKPQNRSMAELGIQPVSKPKVTMSPVYGGAKHHPTNNPYTKMQRGEDLSMDNIRRLERDTENFRRNPWKYPQGR